VPLVRYEIGDVGRLVPGRCACGRSDRRLEFLGRSKDSFILIGSTTSVNEVKSTLEPHGITELQIMLEQKDGVDQITIRYAAPMKLDPKALMGSLNERYGVLGAGKFIFEQVAMGELPRNPVSGKIIGLVNKRS
jgi:phenylacetate-CoA ligase